MSNPTVAVITGASRRFGLLVCESLMSQYDVVVALSRSGSQQLDTLKERGLIVMPCDQSESSDVEDVIRQLRERFDRINLIVHNSSIFNKDPESWCEVGEHLEQHFAVHVTSVARLNFGLASLLSDEQEPGLIVHMTDIFAERPRAEFSLYCATKAALESLTKSLAVKWAPGIRVMSLQPGPVKFLPEHAPEAIDSVLAETPLAREGGFEPLLNALNFIIDNDFLTGSAIKVDGGRAVS